MSFKILHVLYDHPENPWLGGGGAIRAQKINSVLQNAKDTEILLLCGAFPGAEKKAARFVGFSQNYWISRITFAFFSTLYAWQHRNEFDLIVDDVSAFTFFIPPKKVPRISIFHHFIGTHASLKYPLIGKLATWWEARKAGNSKAAICVSEDTAKDFRLHNPHVEPVVIPAGVDLPAPENKSGSNIPNAWRELGFDPQHDFILFLGRIDIVNKGLDLFLDVAENIIKQNLKLDGKMVQFIVAGGGKDSQTFQELLQARKLSNNVFCTGFVNAAEKDFLLRQCLFLLMPSRFEGWGMVAMEAAAYGKVVLGTNIPGLRECVVHQKTGILTSLDSKALSLAAESLLSDGQKRIQLGLAATERARNFSWEALGQRQFEAYLKAI